METQLILSADGDRFEFKDLLWEELIVLGVNSETDIASEFAFSLWNNLFHFSSRVDEQFHY